MGTKKGQQQVSPSDTVAFLPNSEKLIDEKEMVQVGSYFTPPFLFFEELSS